MGFFKRFITKDLILTQKNCESVLNLLEADAVVFDTWSSNFFKRFDDNYNDYQEKRQKKIEQYQFSSSYANIQEFDTHHISNILINLKNDPCWIDIHVCLEAFKPVEISSRISGQFELLREYCINLIENKLENGFQ